MSVDPGSLRTDSCPDRHTETGDIISFEGHLTRVQPCPHLDPEPARTVGDRLGAQDPPRGTVECGEEPVAERLDLSLLVASDLPANELIALDAGGLALVVALLFTLWSGLGVVKAFENAMNTVWNVPLKDRPNFLKSTGRALLTLTTLGIFTVISSLAAGVGSGSSAMRGKRARRSTRR